ncbi:pilin N-terminal domain-containing protein [Enterococcus nangangensis]
MTLKMKATRVAALSLLLAPMALSTFQGVSNVYATGNDTSARLSEDIPEGMARLYINKRQFETMPEDKQNLGTEMDFVGEPLAGVTFEIWDISSTVKDFLNRGFSREDIAKFTVTFPDVGIQFSWPNGTHHQGYGLPIAEVTTNKSGIASIDVDKISSDIWSRGADAAYVIREISHPANVIHTAAPMIVQFPVYEMNADGTYTDNLLDEIYLYPKNQTGSGDILVNKVVQTAGDTEALEGATFIVRNDYDEYMQEVDEDTGVRTWGDYNSAEPFTTDEFGQVSITNIPRSVEGSETFYLEEISTGNEEEITIPEQNKNLEFTLDGTNVTGTKYDYIFEAGSIVNNDLVVDKSTSEDSVQQGESKTYTVSFNVPTDIEAQVDGADKYTNFFLLDEHNEALSMEDITSISFANAAGEITFDEDDVEIYTMPADEVEILEMYHNINGDDTELQEGFDYFGIRWNDPSTTLSDHAGERITVTYKLKLMDKEVADEALLNTATIQTGYETEDDFEEVFTGGKKFVKVDVNTGAELEGAQFYVTNEAGQALWLDADGLYIWDNAPAEFDKNNVPAGLVTLTSGADGEFEIQGLEYGTYNLVEFAEPSDRYILPTDGFEFVVSKGSYASESAEIQEVENKAKGTLPMTGGAGTIVFFLVGAATMAGAAYVVRKNKKTA